jgi:hypothetical protein
MLNFKTLLLKPLDLNLIAALFPIPNSYKHIAEPPVKEKFKSHAAMLAQGHPLLALDLQSCGRCQDGGPELRKGLFLQFEKEGGVD